MNISLLKPKRHPVPSQAAQRSQAEAVARIATLTSVRRSREEDALRVEVNGAEPGEFAARIRAAVEKLELIAAELEAVTA